MTELKPCPLCGERVFLWEDSCGTWVECDKCDIKTQPCDSEEKAVKMWNQKVGLTKIAEGKKLMWLQLHNFKSLNESCENCKHCKKQEEGFSCELLSEYTKKTEIITNDKSCLKTTTCDCWEWRESE